MQNIELFGAHTCAFAKRSKLKFSFRAFAVRRFVARCNRGAKTRRTLDTYAAKWAGEVIRAG